MLRSPGSLRRPWTTTSCLAACSSVRWWNATEDAAYLVLTPNGDCALWWRPSRGAGKYVPPDQVHPNTFIGANRRMRPKHLRLKAREQHNKVCGCKDGPATGTGAVR